MNTYRVQKLSKGKAVVSTRGLRRVVIEPSGKIVKDLCPRAEAEVYARSYNSPAGSTKAVVLKYPQ